MPPVSKKRILLNGFFVWTFWILFYMVVFKIQTGQSWVIAVTSSCSTNYIYALLSIGIWFICRGFPFDKHSYVFLFLFHFILANVCSALWLFLVYGGWYLQAGEAMLTVIPIQEIIGWQFMFGVITYFINAGVFYTLIYYRQFREKELMEKELKILSRDAELKALKMQMNPHFLFNTLNSISALITGDPGLARTIIGKLSDLLRFSLETREKPLIPLQEELKLMHQYLEIEKVRFSDRMSIEETIEPGLETFPVPVMILQPLVENAVRHGIASRRGKSRISISIKLEENQLRINISNPILAGETAAQKTNGRTGTGLKNIQQRLKLLYQDRFSLTAAPCREIFTVDISIPGESA